MAVVISVSDYGFKEEGADVGKLVL